MNWLFKEEPTHYSFDDFTKDKKTMWSGVRNPVAQKHLHAVKKGDRVFFYHTGDEKAVVGVARVVRGAYADPKQKDRRLLVVEIEPEGRLSRPVTLAAMRANRKLAGFDLLRLPRLSVMSVTASQWAEIVRMARA